MPRPWLACACEAATSARIHPRPPLGHGTSLAQDPAGTLTAALAPAGHATPLDTRWLAWAVPAPPATTPASASALTDATAIRRPHDNPPIPASGPISSDPRPGGWPAS